jgi:hypothetical protein
MESTRDREAKTLKLTQKKLKGELLARYGMEAAKGKSVPINPGEKLVRDGEPLDRERFPYSELVGSLLYLSVCTGPDIAQAVGVLVRVRTVFCSSSRYANCLCTALMQHTASHELKP